MARKYKKMINYDVLINKRFNVFIVVIFSNDFRL